MNKTFNNETCWENILIYILKKNFLGASNRKTSPIFGIYTEKIMWRSNWFEQKRRKKKKKRKEKKKVNDWQSCSLTISDSVVCREKKRIDKLPLDSFYFVNHKICFPSYQIGKKKVFHSNKRILGWASSSWSRYWFPARGCNITIKALIFVSQKKKKKKNKADHVFVSN